MTPIADQHDTFMREAIAEILGHAIHDDRWQQLCLPGPLGGCAVLSTAQRSPAAFATTWLQLREKLNQLARAFGLPASFAKQDTEAAKAVEDLRAKAAVITDNLKVDLTAEAQAEYELSPFSLDSCSSDMLCNRQDFTAPEFHGKGLLSRVSRLLAAMQAARLHAAADAWH